MSPKRAALCNILVSLLFAAAILLSSYFLGDELGDRGTLALIAAWLIPFSALCGRGGCCRGGSH